MAEDDTNVEIDNRHKDVVIENLVLTVIHCWMQKSTRDNVHKNAKEGFSPEDIRNATEKLTEVGHFFMERNGCGIRSKVDLYLDDILDVLYRLDDTKQMPKLIIDSVELPKMPLMAVADKETTEASTRLSNVEKGIEDLREAIMNIAVKDNISESPPKIVLPVTNAGKPSYSKAAGGSNGQQTQQARGRQSAATCSRLEPQKLDQAARNRSLSKKRKLEDGSTEDVPSVNKQTQHFRKPAKLNYGTGAEGRAGAGKHVGHFQMFIGRTHPDTTESDIRELVVENTTTHESDGVKLQNVECISELKDDNGEMISKGWKVTMDNNDKEIMMKSSSWPVGWSFRQYFPPKPQRKPVTLYKAGLSLA